MTPHCTCSKKDKNLSDPGQIEHPIPIRSVGIGNKMNGQKYYINCRSKNCMQSRCKKLCKVFENRVRDTDTIDIGKGKWCGYKKKSMGRNEHLIDQMNSKDTCYESDEIVSNRCSDCQGSYNNHLIGDQNKCHESDEIINIRCSGCHGSSNNHCIDDKKKCHESDEIINNRCSDCHGSYNNHLIDDQKKCKNNCVACCNDPDCDVPWSRKELLQNIDINYTEPNNRIADCGSVKDLTDETQKMCPYTPGGIKKKRYFNNEFLRLNLFELPRDKISYGIDLVNVRRNFLQTVFPDIPIIKNDSLWDKLFESKEIKENEPNLFSVRLLELVASKKFENEFLNTPIKYKMYKTRLEELIEHGFLENIELLEYHELFIIALLYVEKHLNGIVTIEFYECLNTLVNEESNRMDVLLRCMPYMLGNLKYSMLVNLFKSLIGYANEFGVTRLFVFEKTCKYFVDKKIKEVKYESFVKLCDILTNSKENK